MTNQINISKSFLEHCRELYKIMEEIEIRMINMGFPIKHPVKVLPYSSKIKNLVNSVLYSAGVITPEKLHTEGYQFWNLKQRITKRF